MAGLISSGIQRVLGFTARDAARTQTLREAGRDAADAGARAGQRKEASLLLEHDVRVGEHPSSDPAVFKRQALDQTIVGRAGTPVGPGDVEAVYQEAFIAHLAPRLGQVLGATRDAGSTQASDATTALREHAPGAREAGQRAVEELARDSFILSAPERGALASGKRLFTVSADGKFQPVPFETRLDWMGEVNIADDAAHSARIARGQSDADKLRAWRYAPTPVKVGVPLAAAGGLGWGAVELLNGDD